MRGQVGGARALVEDAADSVDVRVGASIRAVEMQTCRVGGGSRALGGSTGFVGAVGGAPDTLADVEEAVAEARGRR